MKTTSHPAKQILSAAVVLAMAGLMAAAAVTTDTQSVLESPWSLLPPLIAIVLALVTKEVYSSLFIGIVAGGLLFSGFRFEGTVNHVFQDGIIQVLSDTYNVGILVFLVILGILVCLMNRAGGSAAFGAWASRHIKTRTGAQLATVTLGVLIFIDDYFNCLTVGSVMRPVTDSHRISRAKLAYLIDSTAAPICIIAPISSWAAAVSGFVEGKNGISLFVQTIPYNYYALLTIAMMVLLAVTNLDYGPMKLHEDNARENGDLFTTPDRPYADAGDKAVSAKGRVIDLLIPILSLVVCCVIGMIYSGGFFSGADFITAFSSSDASIGLAYGSFFGLVITLALYLSRRVLSFQDCMACVPEGFKAMVSPILILTFAWSLKAMTDSLGAREFVASLIGGTSLNAGLVPCLIFLVAVFLSFATGTSWGTFGILIPIVVGVFEATDYRMMIISMSACMAGAVCGDHCSPISDTTIMSSAGAQCNHLNHVTTQLPYALTVAFVSFLTYAAAGFWQNPWLCLVLGLVLLTAVILILRYVTRPKKRIEDPA